MRVEHKHLKRKYAPYYHCVWMTITFIILFSYWFRIADRYTVFLYYHDMGPFISSTAPFSYVTRSRYWMAGLVASGAVMVMYCGLNAAMHLIDKTYSPPSWQRVWTVTAIPLAISIPLITMTTSNAPALPFSLALSVTFASLVGLLLALQPGTLVGKHPFDVILLTADGLSIAIIAIGATGIERIPGWLERRAGHFIILTVTLIVAGGVLLLVMSGIRYIFKQLSDTPTNLFVAGLCVAYPGMSILHHIFFTDGYFYITNSDNFFSRNLPLQFGIWVFVWLICAGVSRLRFRLTALRDGNTNTA